jgi:Tol biopolymer transport system component/DNA-binding winged helix-turn-helix (wHTH) protein
MRDQDLLEAASSAARAGQLLDTGAVRIGECIVRPELNEIDGPAGMVRIEPMLTRLLLFLLDHPGVVLDKRRIIEAVWDQQCVSEEVLTNGIWRLRRALGDDARSPHVIQTIHRRGYRLIPESVSPPAPVPEPETTTFTVGRTGNAGGSRTIVTDDHHDEQAPAGSQPAVAWPAESTAEGLNGGPGTMHSRWLWGAVVVPVLIVVLWIAFTDRRGDVVSLGQTHRITSAPGEETYPALSPDGTMIAYVTGTPGARDLFVQQVSGGHTINLTRGTAAEVRWPQWTSDSAHILYSVLGETNHIHLVPTLGGPHKLLLDVVGDHTCAALSPSGEHLAYVSDDTLLIRKIGSAEPEQTITRIPAPHFLTWSPDGSRLACVSDNSLYIAMDNIAPSAIWAVLPAAGTAVQVTDDDNMNTSPVWMPDSKNLLFISDRHGSRDIFQIAINADGQAATPVRRLTTGLNAKSISAAADGRRLAFSVASHEANIWSLPIAGSPGGVDHEPQPVTRGSQVIEAFDVTRDGKWLVYDSNLGGNQDIYRMALPDGEPERLTSHSSDDFGPTWSPDGTQIAFFSLRTGNRDIFVMTADGRELSQVSHDAAEERFPHWAPDGERLVFDTGFGGASRVVAREADGSWGEPTPLPVSARYIRAPRWSPDGELIACPTVDGIVLIPAAGGEPYMLVPGSDELTLSPWPVAWSSDSRTLYYRSYDTRNGLRIWSVAVDGADGGDPQLLVKLGLPTSMPVSADFATDGRRFFFTLPETRGDLWFMELAKSN